MTRIGICTKSRSVRNRCGWLVLLMMILMSASALLYDGANAYAAGSSVIVPPISDMNAATAVEHGCDAGDYVQHQSDCSCICASGCPPCALPTTEVLIDVLQRELPSVRLGPALFAARVAPQLKPPRRIVIA